MIGVITATNRINSITKIFSDFYYNKLKENTLDVLQFDLKNLPLDILNHDMYSSKGMSEELKGIQDKYIYPVDKFVFIVPEYNGTFPGIFKLFIDAISVRENARNFKGKKVALVGISDGRAGNLRGMDHISTFMNYLGANIMPNRLPISQINNLVKDNQIIDNLTIKTIENHIIEIINF